MAIALHLKTTQAIASLFHQRAIVLETREGWLCLCRREFYSPKSSPTGFGRFDKVMGILAKVMSNQHQEPSHMNSTLELVEKIRQQFDTGPYPRVPLEKSPKQESQVLYTHNLSIPYYLRNQKVVAPEGKLILDAGCGSGYKSLVLAEANPGAKVIGVDLSEKSVELARQRLQYHGFENAQFYAISIESLPELGLSFDYINCDDVLYLLPDPAVGLQAMKSVLKPDGIIRANLHSSLQREYFYRAQRVFKLMGLMDDNPAALEIGLVQDTMKALQDRVMLKATTWCLEMETDDERILANHLLQGDKGYTVPEMLSFIRAAELEFVSMVNWRQWNLRDLFKEPNNLPAFLELTLPEITTEEWLHLYELFHPIHRLLDFWCGHPEQGESFIPIADWTTSDWQQAQIHLVPQLRTPEIKADLIASIKQLKQFEIGKHLTISDNSLLVENTTAACLLPLWEEAQSMKFLVERWQKLKPVDPLTLEPTTTETAWQVLIEALTALESLGYVLIEPR
jgi:2-polyprenyl-3-methyl-5-hydroxy-6-metoxy-1,4-benzoquinol methylase